MIMRCLTITKGCIHTPIMEIAIGGETRILLCGPIRAFIRAANDIGLKEVLNKVNDDPELLTLLYEEFKDQL